VKYAFIRQHREQYSLQSLNKVLHVSRSGYYDWLHRAPSARVQTNNALLGHIRAAHINIAMLMGRSDMALPEFCRDRMRQTRVARLRKQAGIEAQRKRRFRLTVEYHHTPKAALICCNANSAVMRPTAWVGDMTFIRTRQGWLHLVVLLDLFSRKVVGWAMEIGRQQYCIGQHWKWRLRSAARKRAWYTIPTGERYIAHLPIVSYWNKPGCGRA